MNEVAERAQANLDGGYPDYTTALRPRRTIKELIKEIERLEQELYLERYVKDAHGNRTQTVPSLS